MTTATWLLDALKALASGRDLTSEEVRASVSEMLAGEASIVPGLSEHRGERRH